jgi:PERQ amino acid-rich with GYF domain-containing protein
VETSTDYASSTVSTELTGTNETLVYETPIHIKKSRCHLPNKGLFAVLSVAIVLGVAVPISLGVYAMLLVKPAPLIDKSIESFAIPNHLASRRYDALRSAADNKRGFIRNYERQKRSAISEDTDSSMVDYFLGLDAENEINSNHILFRQKRGLDDSDYYKEGRRIYGATQSSRKWKLTIIYVAQGSDDLNIFTKERLQDIHNIEKNIMEHKGFQTYCLVDYAALKKDPTLDKFNGCAPLNTLLTYFYPMLVGEPGNGTVYFNSFGSTLYDEINTTLSLAMTHSSFYWYVDDHMSPSNKRSTVMLSEVHFGVPVLGEAAIATKIYV